MESVGAFDPFPSHSRTSKLSTSNFLQPAAYTLAVFHPSNPGGTWDLHFQSLSLALKMTIT